MTIHGGPYTFADDESMSMILRRQTSFKGRWKAQLQFPTCIEDEEAGIVVWLSKISYCSIGIRGVGSTGERNIVTRCPGEKLGSFEVSLPERY